MAHDAAEVGKAELNSVADQDEGHDQDQPHEQVLKEATENSEVNLYAGEADHAATTTHNGTQANGTEGANEPMGPEAKYVDRTHALGQQGEEEEVEQGTDAQVEEEQEEAEEIDPNLKLLLSLGNTGNSFLPGEEEEQEGHEGDGPTDSPRTETDQQPVDKDSVLRPSEQSSVTNGAPEIQEERSDVQEEPIKEAEENVNVQNDQGELQDNGMDLEIQKSVGNLLANLSRNMDVDRVEDESFLEVQSETLAASASEQKTDRSAAAAPSSASSALTTPALEAAFSQADSSASRFSSDDALKTPSILPSSVNTSSSSILTAAPVVAGPDGTLAPPTTASIDDMQEFPSPSPSRQGQSQSNSVMDEEPDRPENAGDSVDLDVAIRLALAGAVAQVNQGQEGGDSNGYVDDNFTQHDTAQEDGDSLASHIASITRAAEGLDSMGNPLPGNEQSHQKLSEVVKRINVNDKTSNSDTVSQSTSPSDANQGDNQSSTASIKDSDMEELNRQVALALSHADASVSTAPRPPSAIVPRPRPPFTSAPRPGFPANIQRPPSGGSYPPRPSFYRPPRPGQQQSPPVRGPPYAPPRPIQGGPRPSYGAYRPIGADQAPRGFRPAARPQLPPGILAGRPATSTSTPKTNSSSGSSNRNRSSEKPKSKYVYVSESEEEEEEESGSEVEDPDRYATRDSIKDISDKQKPPKKYKCPLCQRSFARAYNLGTHRATHDPEPDRAKPHRCPFPACKAEGGKAFSRKHDLQRHMASNHEHDDEPGKFGDTIKEAVERRQREGIPDDYNLSQENWDPDNPTGGLGSLGFESTSKKYECRACHRAFVRRDAFTKHKCDAKAQGPLRRKLPPSSSLASNRTTSSPSTSSSTPSVTPSAPRIPPVRSSTRVSKPPPPPAPIPTTRSRPIRKAALTAQASWSADGSHESHSPGSDEDDDSNLYTNSRPTNGARASDFDPASLGLPSSPEPENEHSRSNIQELQSNLNSALIIGGNGGASTMDLNSMTDLQNLASQEGLDESVRSIISQLLTQKEQEEEQEEEFNPEEVAEPFYFGLPPLDPPDAEDGPDSLNDLVQKTLAAAQASLVEESHEKQDHEGTGDADAPMAEAGPEKDEGTVQNQITHQPSDRTIDEDYDAPISSA